jgi:hypothetical protein
MSVVLQHPTSMRRARARGPGSIFRVLTIALLIALVGAMTTISAVLAVTPVAPGDLAGLPDDGKAQLSWGVSSQTEINKYQYSYESDSNGDPIWVDIADSSATTTKATILGLTNGTKYTIQLRAVDDADAAGNGATSNVDVTPNAPPAKPAGATATIGASQITLKWNDPNDDLITVYQLQSRKVVGGSYGPWADIEGSDKDTVEHTLLVLENGDAYNIKLRAVRGAANSPEVVFSGVTPNAPPVAIGLFTATASNRVIVLAWTASTDAGTTGYDYRYSTDGGTTWNPDWTATPSTTNTFTLSGLTNAVEYTVELRATGPGGESATVTATLYAGLQPAPPADLTVTARGIQSVTLGWTSATAVVTGYQYQLNGSGPWKDIPTITGATQNPTYEVTGLTDNVEYSFAIRGKSDNGFTAASDSVKGTPGLRPLAVVGLSAARISATGLTFSWTEVEDTSVTGREGRYRPKSSTDTGFTDWAAIIDSATTVEFTDLTADTEYTFEVRRLGIGVSPVSSIKATPSASPLAPKNLVATPGDKKISLKWAVPNDTSVTGYQYRVRIGDGAYVAVLQRVSAPALATDGVEYSRVDAEITTTDGTIELKNGTEYTVQLRAVPDGVWSSAINITPGADTTVGPTPDAPSAPAGLEATVGDGEVSLSWDDPDDGSITGYQYRLDDGDWVDVADSGATTTEATIGDLTNGQEYAIELRAQGSGGDGTESSATAMPEAGAVEPQPTPKPKPQSQPAPAPAPVPAPPAKPVSTTSSFSNIIVESSVFTTPDTHLEHNIPSLKLVAEAVRCDFTTHYDETGGVMRWGYATSEVLEDHPGVLTQYYQRGVVDCQNRDGVWRIERRLNWDYIGGGVAGAPDMGVEPGLLSDQVGMQVGPWHKVSNWAVDGTEIGFLDFFEALGGVRAFGYPKTEARYDNDPRAVLNIPGATAGFIRQYFQAAVMEYHPSDGSVKLRLLGDDLRNRLYADGSYANFASFRSAMPLVDGSAYMPEAIKLP